MTKGDNADSGSNNDTVYNSGISSSASSRSIGEESTSSIVEVGKSIVNFVGDVISLLFTEDNITSLMSQLDDEQNWNLFYIINFLNSYYSSNTTASQKDYQNLMTLYGELIQKIKPRGERYKYEVKNSHQGLHYKDSDKIPNHTQIIDKFKDLESYEQQNLKYLTWYILYCKIELDINNPNRRYPIWQNYSQLMEEIKSLPINQ